jgi:hypothetical protein
VEYVAREDYAQREGAGQHEPGNAVLTGVACPGQPLRGEGEHQRSTERAGQGGGADPVREHEPWERRRRHRV